MKRTILILGGGFGGVYTAVYLEKFMTRHGRDFDIVIVSRDNYMVFQPLLPEVSFRLGRVEPRNQSDPETGKIRPAVHPRG